MSKLIYNVLGAVVRLPPVLKLFFSYLVSFYKNKIYKDFLFNALLPLHEIQIPYIFELFFNPNTVLVFQNEMYSI